MVYYTILLYGGSSAISFQRKQYLRLSVGKVFMSQQLIQYVSRERSVSKKVSSKSFHSGFVIQTLENFSFAGMKISVLKIRSTKITKLDVYKKCLSILRWIGCNFSKWSYYAGWILKNFVSAEARIKNFRWNFRDGYFFFSISLFHFLVSSRYLPQHTKK